MSIVSFIADRIFNSKESKGNISKPIVKIGIIGIAIGIAVMILTVSIVLGFKREIVQRIRGLTTDIAISNVTINPGSEPLPIKISNDSLQLIAAMPAIKHIQATGFKSGLLKTANENEGILVKGVDKNFDFSFLKEHLVEGRMPDFTGNEASKDIFISERLATKLQIKLNEKISIYFLSHHDEKDSLGNSFTKSEPRSRKFTICGIFKTEFTDFDSQLSLVDLRHLQKINYWDENTVGNYEIKLKNFENLNSEIDELKDLLGYNYSVNGVKEIYANIFIWLDKLDINGIIIIVLMILVATINMITALLILILERTNMVGLLKALGMDNLSLRKIFIQISFRLIGKGLLWGNIIGIGLCLIQYYFKPLKLESETYYISYVAVDLQWMYYLFLNVGTFVVCALMLVLPTIVISKLTPIKTLKFD